MKITKFVAPLVSLASVVAPVLTLAQSTPVTPTPGPIGGIEQLFGIIVKISNYFFTVLLLLAVIFVIVAAFRYLTAGGEAEDISKAHQSLIYAGVAILVGVLAKTIIFVVGQIAGYSVPFF